MLKANHFYLIFRWSSENTDCRYSQFPKESVVLLTHGSSMHFDLQKEITKTKFEVEEATKENVWKKVLECSGISLPLPEGKKRFLPSPQVK